jgi:CHAT domain-containing protein
LSVKSPVARRTAALALTLLALGSGGCGQRRGEVAELMEALGPRRPVEPRLTGELAYAPCRPARAVEGRVPDALCSALPRPGSAHWRALEKVGKRVNRQHRPTPQRLQAQGLERLLWRRQEGAADMAVEKLRQASSLAPKDAHLWSDLAAALYVQAQQEGEPRDLLFALSAAGTAVDLAPALPEALFNRALLLDRLYLRSEATAGWKRYLEVDSRSPWAGEARAHLTALQAPSVPELWKRQLPTLRAAATTGDEKMLAALVATSPQTAREYAVEEVLGQWGSDILAGKGSEAAVELRVAGGIGRALVARGGDGTVAQAVAVIERATVRPDVLSLLAHGHQAYAQGSAAFRQLQIEGSQAPFEEARSTLEVAGDPVGLWAEMGSCGIAFYGYRYDAAVHCMTSVLTRVDIRRFPALSGRARWTLGITRLRQGQLSASLGHFQVAVKDFSQAHESEYLGAIHARLAENLRLLGDHESAWKHRYQAMADLQDFPASLHLHTLLRETADATRDGVSLEVARVVQDEGVRVAENSGNPRMIAEALLWRSGIQATSGALDAALTDLRQAHLQIDRIPGGVVRDKLSSDINFAHGEVESQRDPRRAISFLDDAISYYQKNRLDLNLAIAYSARGRAAIVAKHEADAEADFDAAIAIFERQRATLEDNGLRLSYSEAVQGLFDDRILLAAARPKEPKRAFDFAERARTVPLDLLPSNGGDWSADPTRAAAVPEARFEHDLHELPEKVAFVEYAWIGDRLFRWTLQRGSIESEPLLLSPHALEERIEAFVGAVQGRSEEKLAGPAALLYEDLVPLAARSLPADFQLFFIPDKSLHQVPFATLKNPATGRYLIEEHAAVGVLPSVTFYLSARREMASPRGWTALLVGNPAFDRNLFQDLKDLPQADTEITEVAKIYPGAPVLRGPDATKDNLLAQLDEHEVLEYAGHAIDNPKHPPYSYLVLAPSQDRVDRGMLFSHELARLRLKKLRLVVLAACHTIAARSLRISAFSGIARPFLDAGAQAVLGTLWSVDDRLAGTLVPEFHRRFRATGDATAALRGAQLACLQGHDPALRSPAFWGAFEVVGAISPP